MTPFKKTQETIVAATEQVNDSTNLLMLGVGLALVISTIALVVAVAKK